MSPWQPIKLETLHALREHYLQYEPYCNLNVVDLWSYRGGPNHWFKIGDTVVYQLNDYMDNSYYITLLGTKSVKQAVIELCKQDKSKKNLVLKCLPEESLSALGKWGAITEVKEDIDNHDYIFDVDSLINFSSERLRHKHKSYRQLVRRYPSITVRRLDITKDSNRQLVYKLYAKWVAQNDPPDWDKEFLALKRALNLKGVNLVCLGVFDNRKMIGFTVNESESNGYYQAFFGKADRKYPGLGLLLEHETAKYMHEHFGSKYMNLQCDSGIEGLRNYKTSLGPARHLKKYIVTINAAKARQSA